MTSGLTPTVFDSDTEASVCLGRIIHQCILVLFTKMCLISSHFRGSNKTIVPSLGSLGKYLIDLKGSWMLFESSLTAIRELFFGGLWRSAFGLGSPQKDKSNKLTCQRNV